MKIGREVFALLLSIGLAFGTADAWGARLVINGSTTVYPIAKKASDDYARANPTVQFEIVPSGSGNGIKALIDGTTDIANASRFMKDKEIRMAMEKGVFPVCFRIAYDCIVPVVHPGNPVQDLTMEQLKLIFQGVVTDWGEVGGNPGQILVVSRDTSSGTFEVWHEKVMQNQDFLPSAALRDSNQKLMETVAEYPQAIGYVGLGYVNPTVKAISVGGVAGTELTALDGSFPISRPLFMFTSGYPQGEALKFINYMLEPAKGQKHVKASGFVSLYEPQAETEPPMSTPPPLAAIRTVSAQSSSDGHAAAGYGNLDYRQYLDMSWPEKVLTAQKYLNSLQYPVGPIDGIWGPLTYAAVMHYQQDNGLPADGKITFKLVQSMARKTSLQ